MSVTRIAAWYQLIRICHLPVKLLNAGVLHARARAVHNDVHMRDWPLCCVGKGTSGSCTSHRRSADVPLLCRQDEEKPDRTPLLGGNKGGNSGGGSGPVSMPTSNGNLAPTANGIKEGYSNDDSYRCEAAGRLALGAELAACRGYTGDV